MHTDARDRIAAAQLDLVRALVINHLAPADFDSSRIRAAADALLLKRARSVARHWPATARSLGCKFEKRFALYARSTPGARGGACADGRGFVSALAREGPLTDEVAVETLTFDLRYRIDAHGVITQRHFSLAAVLLKESLRFIAGIRIPVFGEQRISVPLKFLLKHSAPQSV